MIAFARVLLPDPFGPISAWTSPLRMDRLTPLRISLLATLTCKVFDHQCLGVMLPVGMFHHITHWN